jgi:hypothetical protein
LQILVRSFYNKLCPTTSHTGSGAGTIGHGRARAPPLLKPGGHGGAHLDYLILCIFTRI